MKTRYLVICAALCAAPWIALAHDNPREDARSQSKTGTPASDANVLSKLHETNLAEIEAGRLAKANSNDDDVKNYGEMLQSDHEAADNQVQDMARDRYITLADKLPADSDATAMLGKLRSLQGAAFDREFLDMMQADHEKAIGMVKAWQSDVSDKQLRSLLDRLLPKLQKHRDEAKRLSRKT